MSIALIGIVSLQLAMIRDSYVQKQQLFDQSVNAALVDVVKSIEKAEAIDYIQDKSDRLNKIYVKTTKEASKPQKEQHYTTKVTASYKSETREQTTNREREARMAETQKSIHELERKIASMDREKELRNVRLKSKDLKRLTDSLKELRNSFEFNFSENNFSFTIPDFPEWSDSIFTSNFEHSGYIIHADSIAARSGSYRRSKSTPSRAPKTRVTVRSFAADEMPPAPPMPPVIMGDASPIIVFSNPEKPKKEIVKKYFDNNKKEKIEIIQDLAAELAALSIPLQNRIKPKQIDSLLKLQLEKHGIVLPYELVINGNKDSIFFNTSTNAISDFSNVYSTTLFDQNESELSASINVSFPDREEKLSSEMGPTLASSVLLLAILVGCFAYTIYAILKQKKLADLKNDFINNMTHEFKTPVSTISLASEALKDPSVINDDERVKRLAGIIYDENLRLGEHVERVLNMARMDKGEIKLAMNSVSAHSLIDDALKHFELSLANKEQKIVKNLKASNDLIYADEFHLKNILQNLIDNASKYSTPGSTIFIDTLDTKNEIIIKVRDQGIGMKREQIKKIFEPFYRVPTGNLHDVKGFGIGLHYVHSILKVMNGKIGVKSEIGLGSEFSLTFPK